MEIIVTEQIERIDKYITNKLKIDNPKITRQIIQKGIEEKSILLNSKETKNNAKISLGDVITIDMNKILKIISPPKIEITEKDLELITKNIVYEDEYLLIVNKPKGLIVHKGNSIELTMSDILEKIYPFLPGEEGRKGIVHRLDKDTTGLIMVAKTEETYIKCIEMFKNHKVIKKYYCIVKGEMKDKEAIIKLPIGRNSKKRYMMAVSSEGKEAITKFNNIYSKKGYTFLDVEIFTGRTHQIRVHLSYLGYPIIGDNIYSNGKNVFGINGQVLQSYYLKFEHPITKQNLEFKLPEYEEIQQILKEMGE